MKKNKKVLFVWKPLYILLLTFFIVGCGSTVNIESNKKLNYNKKIESVFILIESASDKDSEGFLYLLFRDVESNLNARGIKVSHHYINPLSLKTDEEVQKAILDSGASFLMKIKQTNILNIITDNSHFVNGSNNLGSFSKESGATYSFELKDVNSKEIVWKSVLKASSPFGVVDTVEEASAKFLKKLIEDNLL
jgi:hypothetical protein